MKNIAACFFLCFCTVCLLAAAQKPTADSLLPVVKQKEFFTDDEPVVLTLTSDFRRLRRKKEKDVFQPADVRFSLAGKPPISAKIELAARGNYRRETCPMPSLFFNCKGREAGGLSGLKKLKMVCGCNTGEYNQNLLLKEYLVYKIYNLLTNMSFRVRLADVTYVDAGNANKAYRQYAFFVEDVDAMARRNDCVEFEKTITTSQAANRRQGTLMHIFQYMIGNLDWSAPNRHNVKLICPKADTLSAPFTVPYDFDFCGLVDAPYAHPQEQFNVQSVKERLYRGFPRMPEEVDAALQPFREKKDGIYACINSFTLLPEAQRKTMTRFLDEFYRTIESKRDVQAIFVEARQNN